MELSPQWCIVTLPAIFINKDIYVMRLCWCLFEITRIHIWVSVFLFSSAKRSCDPKGYFEWWWVWALPEYTGQTGKKYWPVFAKRCTALQLIFITQTWFILMLVQLVKLLQTGSYFIRHLRVTGNLFFSSFNFYFFWTWCICNFAFLRLSLI